MRKHAVPTTRFARTPSGSSIAYHVIGESEVSIVSVPPMAQNIEMAWEWPAIRRMFEGFATFCRFVPFDKRGTGMSNRSLDTMDLTLHLERDGAFAGRPPIRRFTLDALCELFGVVPHDRHTATGDAFITAQVFLRLLRLASRHGRPTLGRLSEPFLEPAGP